MAKLAGAVAQLDASCLFNRQSAQGGKREQQQGESDQAG